MGGLSLPHLIILALVVLILFGRGRISEMMGDFGKGIKEFKKGVNEGTETPLTPPAAQIPQTPPPPPAAAAPQPVQTEQQNSGPTA
ncbi:twin-arginine translocase TatA/TatE family subunit [Novosphingobium cyanobacteriorum]|uniref:Sec-independent protein translocase protein TatA n=1 Tax=Novosphingobium cyanobacteriorum TaxID=3024215 RepID=A0ABT6CM05_9SPHN|nr:twin-arginine translocase TatA/TatE family subunit [Novosphingobium cyanobacteriorum]MDF8333362.1 twin-arginine translocase TatA/TatE family subunit [Novosphingobium cyanobacteriorum]